MLIETLIYLGVGSVAGFLAGMLGVGGGIIIVPLLGYVFFQQGYSPETVLHLAVGTSIATIAVTSLSAVRAHHRRDSVNWTALKTLLPGLIAGAVMGAAIADLFSTRQLLFLLALLEIFVAIQLLVNKVPKISRPMPRGPIASFIGLIIASISTIAGVGGGVLLVPMFLWFSMPIRQAVATSSACGFSISLIGTLVFLSYGFSGEVSEPGSFGYVHIAAFFGIALTSVVFAPIGVAAAHRLPISWLRRAFAVFLLLLASRIFWSAAVAFS